MPHRLSFSRRRRCSRWRRRGSRPRSCVAGAPVRRRAARPRRAAPRGAAPAAARRSIASVPLDRVVAVVNDEALTQYDVNEQKRIVLAQMKTQNVHAARGRRAREAGARAADHRARAAAVREGNRHSRRRHAGRAHDPAHRAGQQAVARRIPQGAWSAKASRTRSTARTSATKSRSSACASARSTAASPSATPRSTTYLATLAAQAGGEIEYRLAHILVLVPEQASPDQIDARQRRARRGAAADAGRARISGRSPRASPMRRTPCRAATSAGARRRGCRRCSPSRCAGMKPGDVSPACCARRAASTSSSCSRRAAATRRRSSSRRALRHILIKVNEITSDAEAKAKIDRIQRPHRDRREVRGPGEAQFRGRAAPRRAATWAGSRPATRCPTSSRR